MDLIYTNSAHVDQGVLMDYDLDLAYGADENNFECRISAASHCCEAGSMLYIEETEYGGIIDSIESDSSTDEVIYSGRTWHGVLGSKIIMPLQTGEASTAAVTLKTTDSSGGSLVDRYLIISGDANSCIGFILSRVGLSTLFEASSVSSGVNINQYQFDRFTDAYKGITKMLSSAGLKPVFTFTDGKVIISAAAKHDFTTDEEFDSDLIEFQAKKNYKTVNHLICLGTGELENRTVVHLYADTEGNISQTQTQFGLDEYVATYDYSSVESEDELIASGKEKLQELWNQDKLSIDFDESMDSYDVGDIVGAVDNITGLSIKTTITKKIVKISNGQITIDISTDAVSASGSGSTGDSGYSGAYCRKIYPSLTSNQKAAIKALIKDYVDNRSAFYYYGDHTRNAFATGSIYDSESGKWGLNCETFVQNILMGRSVSDYVGKTADTYTNTITKTDVSDFGHYFEFENRKTAYGLIRDSEATDPAKYYYGYVKPLADSYKYSYSRNSYWSQYAEDAGNVGGQNLNSFMLAGDMAFELYQKGCEISMSELEVGDILFNKHQGDDATESATFFHKIAWRNIAHVFLVYDISSDGKITLAECTSGLSAPIALRPQYGSYNDDRTRFAYMMRNTVFCARLPAAWGEAGNVPDSITVI